MKRVQIFSHRVLACLLALSLTLSACATGPRVVDHSFAFDVRIDSPQVTLLNYRYPPVSG